MVISRVAPCDTGGADTIVHGGVNGLTIERDVARLRHVREEARLGVETRVEREGSWGADGTRTSAAWPVGIIVYTRRREPPELVSGERGDTKAQVGVEGERGEVVVA